MKTIITNKNNNYYYNIIFINSPITYADAMLATCNRMMSI